MITHPEIFEISKNCLQICLQIKYLQIFECSKKVSEEKLESILNGR